MSCDRSLPHAALLLMVITALACLTTSNAGAGEAYVPFTTEKSSWHGFDRYDFQINTQTLAITSFTPSPTEKDGIASPTPGTRRCVIVVPKEVSPGAPWSWRGCYWNHEPQTEIELLKNGFHIAYISASADLKPDQTWDAWYAFLTGMHGLSAKPAFIGMSRGGLFAYTWATANPTKVSCIYADNPAIDHDVFARLIDLAHQDVPVLHVCGSIDPLLGRNTLPVESLYQQFGGRISLIIKDGAGHHPHSLRDPKPIVDFITQSVREVPTAIPAYVGQKVSRTVLYGLDTIFRDVPGEGLHISYRGAAFVECFDRLVFELPGVEGQVTVIAPKSPASGTPWVLRSAFVTRDDVVDLALLAQGYHIVTGPVPYNADGPQRPSWDAVYQHLTANGFSAKLVVEGVGAGAGDEIAWAAENPDKVSGIYLENALLLRSHMSHAPVLDQLAPLAQAHIVMLGFYGNCPPEIAANATLASTTYQALGGQMTVITQEGAGQAPTLPTDAKPLVDVITHRMK